LIQTVCAMSRILVTGGEGQLGQCFQQQAKSIPDWIFFFPGRNEVDITDFDSLETFVKKNQIDTIVNTAAYTQVDRAEDNAEEVYAVNEKGIENVLEIANQHQLKTVFFSTDYVFHQYNTDILIESDTISPQGVYAESKAAGEALIAKATFPTVLIRTSWLFSPFGKNFVKTILNLAQSNQDLKVVNDQWGSPTYGPDLANMVLQLLRQYPLQKEIFHVVNAGVTNWCAFAQSILKQSGLKKEVQGIPTEAYPTPAPRPQRSVLGTSKIQSYLGTSLRSWEESLADCLNQLRHG
jgi:dTDP-4-dehydrorhamnose reductase